MIFEYICDVQGRDSLMTWRMLNSSGQLEVRQISRFTYQNGQIFQSFSKSYQNGALFYHSRSTYFYNAGALLKEVLGEVLVQGNFWKPTSRNLLSYDGASNRISKVEGQTYDSNTGGWVNDLRISYTYFPSGDLKSETQEISYTNGAVWLPQYTRSFDIFGYLLYEKSQYIDETGQLIYGNENIYTYIGEKLQESLAFYLDETSPTWQKSSRYKAIFDADDELLADSSYYFEPNISATDWFLSDYNHYFRSPCVTPTHEIAVEKLACTSKNPLAAGDEIRCTWPAAPALVQLFSLDGRLVFSKKNRQRGRNLARAGSAWWKLFAGFTGLGWFPYSCSDFYFLRAG